MSQKLEARDYQLIRKVAARWNHALSFDSHDQFATGVTSHGTIEIINGWHDSFAAGHQSHVGPHSLVDGFFSVIGRSGMRELEIEHYRRSCSGRAGLRPRPEAVVDIVGDS